MLSAWPEAQQTLRDRRRRRRCCAAPPDGTPYIAAAQRIEGADRQVLLLTVNARDIRRVVRAERYSLFLILVGTLIVSILLSRFLARTIAKPLRRLAHAAHRVRLGSAREVDVPTLPCATRRDRPARPRARTT